GASRGPPDRRKFCAARHAVRHRSPAPVRRGGSPATTIPRFARSGLGSERRHGAALRSTATERHIRARHHRRALEYLPHGYCWKGGKPDGWRGAVGCAGARCTRFCGGGGAAFGGGSGAPAMVASGSLQSVSQTSYTACSTPCRPGLAANIQPEKIRFTSPCSV